MHKKLSLFRDTYDDEDALKDGTSLVSSPVRVTEECTNKREYVDRPSPFADAVRRVGIVLLQHSGEEQHQIHSYSKKC